MIGGVLNGAKETSELLYLTPRLRLPKSLTFHPNRYILNSEQETLLLQKHDQDVIGLRYYHSRHIPLTATFKEPKLVDPVPDRECGSTEHVARRQSRRWWAEATTKLFSDLQKLGINLTPPRAFQKWGEERREV